MRVLLLSILGAAFLFQGNDQPSRFVPPIRIEGGTAVVPAVFPDGARIELRYPQRLGLASRGVRPFGSGAIWSYGAGRAGRDFSVFHQQSATYLFERRSLAERYDGAEGGTVEYWRGPHAQPDFLVFRFGRWILGVWDRGYLTSEEKALWARSLVGRESVEGYLVLSARPPLRLARAGEHAGPELIFGDSMRRTVLLIRGACRRRAPSRSSWFSSWCLPHAHLRVHVYGRPRFANAVFVGLKIRRVR